MSDTDAGGKTQARRLGRGLSALLGDVGQDVAVSQNTEAVATPDDSSRNSSVQMIDVSLVTPHPDQPRRQFDDAALSELADSIRARGVIQPIIVRPAGRGRYQIVAGERRWRAAQKAQLHQIPALVRDFDEAETLEIALVENIQRQDLNPIEEAQAYRRLMDQFQHSQDALGRIVGKSRSHVANLVRLLELPEPVQDQLMKGQLSMGHGRALIGVPDCIALAEEVAAKGLSVRETEKLVRLARDRSSQPTRESVSAISSRDPDLIAMERHLSDLLGVKIGISHQGGKGALTLHYGSLEQLDMICQKLTGGGF